MEIAGSTLGTIVNISYIAGLILGSGVGYAFGRLNPGWIRPMLVFLGVSSVIHGFVAYDTFSTVGHSDKDFTFQLSKSLPIAFSAFSIWYSAGAGLAQFNL